MIVASAVAVVLMAFSRPGPGCDTPPLVILRDAEAAVARDGAAAEQRRWRDRLAHDPGDRSAIFALATLARLTDLPASAESLFARLAAQGPPSVDACTAYASLGRGDLHMARGEFQPAQLWYDRAEAEARVTRDASARGRALIGLASTRARTLGTAASARTLDALSAVLPPDDSNLVASYRCERAGLLARTGEQGARPLARAGADLARAAGDRRMEARCLWVLATDFVRVGDMGSAGAALDSAEGLLRRARHHSGLASLLQWHGFLAVSTGEYGAAQRLLREALAEATRSGNRSALAWSQLNLTQIALAVRDLATAGQLAGEATASFASTSDAWGLATAMGLQAQIALDAGDTARARRLLMRLRTWAARERQPLAVAQARLGLADLAVRGGAWMDAERELAAGRRTLRDAGGRDWEMGLSFYEGIIALRRGRLDTAVRLLRGALDSLAPDQTSRAYVIQATLAEAVLARGDTLRAGTLLREADAQLDAWRATLAGQELRLLAFQVREPFGGRAPAVQRVIAAVAARGDVAAAFALAERRRARELRDQLSRAIALRSRASDASAGSTSDAIVPTVAAVQQSIPDDRTAVLEYVAGADDQPSTLFVVRRGAARAYVLQPADSLRDAIARFGALLQEGAPAASLARQLGRAVVHQALADLPRTVSRLVIVPDDALSALPFQALVLVDGRRLIERYSVAVAPSAAVAAVLWHRPAARGPIRLIALGDPAPAREGGLAPLPASATEVRRVAHFARDATVRVGDAATRQALEAAARAGARVIHIAAHALVDPGVIARTHLQLAPGPRDDGVVTPGDLAALRLEADLVVLSSCRTAAGVVLGGEGVRGLTAPLLQAGARTVVASDWPVSDRRTVRFMTDFYDALSRGLDAADALRDAERRALAAGAAPRDWAAFRLVGDPSMRIPLQRPNALLRWWWSR